MVKPRNIQTTQTSGYQSAEDKWWKFTLEQFLREEQMGQMQLRDEMMSTHSRPAEFVAVIGKATRKSMKKIMLKVKKVAFAAMQTAPAVAEIRRFSLFLLNRRKVKVLALTVWQVVDVLPHTQEVRVSQRSLGADSAPGVKLQAESKHRG